MESHRIKENKDAGSAFPDPRRKGFIILKKTCHLAKVTLVLLLTLGITAGCASGAAKQNDNPTTPTVPSTEPVTPPQSGTPAGEEDQPIAYEDPVFGKLLKAELKKEGITSRDLDQFTRITIGGDHFISLSGKDIPEKSIILFYGTEVELEGKRYTGFGTMKTLQDLRHFRNLDQLKVTLQPEIDYSTIPKEILSKLRLVSITQSKISDISFLSGAASMFSLNLAFGEVRDLAPLADCKELVYLSGNSNAIDDLSPLAGLTKLKSISLYSSQIKDLTPLAGLANLESLELYDNQVEDLTPLSGLKSLKELELINNQVKDVSPLKDFESFESIRLNGNPIENIEELDHIENLQFEP